jgi:hypothetical protein
MDLCFGLTCLSLPPGVCYLCSVASIGVPHASLYLVSPCFKHGKEVPWPMHKAVCLAGPLQTAEPYNQHVLPAAGWHTSVALLTFAQHSALASLGNNIFDCGVHSSCAQQCK